ncbi:MAG: molybdopterin biosynthesis protein, partial [Anaerolineaceae bacterium]|nr:molybdopterin biosynthesis protein [Anaerolineaceae bacterium]
MAIYLHDIPLDQARSVFHQSLQAHGYGKILGVEQISLDEDAIGRVIAEPVWARISSPHYHASAMDGFALRSADTLEATQTNPVVLNFPEQIKYMDTGDPIPDWADCVVPIENVESLDVSGKQAENPRSPAKIQIRASLVPWSHIRPVGEDIVASQLVLPAGHTIRAIDLGALAACGCVSIPVARKPVVGIIPTGTELIKIGIEPRSGDIIEYNSMVLSGHIRTWGGSSVRYPITPDVYEQIRERVQAAADVSDLVLLNAGSSAGSEDFSSRIVEELGTLLVHGVAVRPGHPVILGMIKRSQPIEGQPAYTPIIGVPGYPVSAALTNEIFVQPLMDEWLGRSPNLPEEIDASITRKVSSPAGDDDYLRVVVGMVDGKTLAAPVARGAGVITSLVRADGIVIIPAGSQGLEAGSSVKVHLYRKRSELDHTILAIGSHDITLDILSQYLSVRGRRLTSANTGSVGGLVA